jgi:hypothetical protein
VQAVLVVEEHDADHLAAGDHRHAHHGADVPVAHRRLDRARVRARVLQHDRRLGAQDLAGELVAGDARREPLHARVDVLLVVADLAAEQV